MQREENRTNEVLVSTRNWYRLWYINHIVLMKDANGNCIEVALHFRVVSRYFTCFGLHLRIPSFLILCINSVSVT